MTSNWIRQATPWFVISLNITITSAHKWQNIIELNRRGQLDIRRPLSSTKVERAVWYMVQWEKCTFSLLVLRLNFISFGLKILVWCSNENKRKRNAGTCRKNCMPTLFFLPLAGMCGTTKNQFHGKSFSLFVKTHFHPFSWEIPFSWNCGKFSSFFLLFFKNRDRTKRKTSFPAY